jgi:hypothetical protein
MRLFTILALTCLIFSSCSYSSNEIYFMDVNTDILPNIDITSNLDTSITYDILDSILFKYEIMLDTGEIFFTQIYFNNEYIFLSEEMSDSLWINPEDTLADGSYELDMEILYKSTTGSLADKFDLEFILKDTTWLVKLGREEVKK